MYTLKLENTSVRIYTVGVKRTSGSEIITISPRLVIPLGCLAEANTNCFGNPLPLPASYYYGIHKGKILNEEMLSIERK